MVQSFLVLVVQGHLVQEAHVGFCWLCKHQQVQKLKVPVAVVTAPSDTHTSVLQVSGGQVALNVLLEGLLVDLLLLAELLVDGLLQLRCPLGVARLQLRYVTIATSRLPGATSQPGQDRRTERRTFQSLHVPPVRRAETSH